MPGFHEDTTKRLTVTPDSMGQIKTSDVHRFIERVRALTGVEDPTFKVSPNGLLFERNFNRGTERDSQETNQDQPTVRP